MKRLIALSFVMIMLFLAASAPLSARHRESDTYLTLSFFINPFHVGVKHKIFDNVYAVGNMDYVRSRSDLEFQVGAVYMIPRKILIFRFYVGPGFQISRNESFQYPFVTVGTKVWILFWEMNHPLRERLSPQYRFGMAFRF